MIVPSGTRSWLLGILKYTVLTNSSCQVFLLSERKVSFKYDVLIRLTYMRTERSGLSTVCHWLAKKCTIWPCSSVQLEINFHFLENALLMSNQ